MAPGVIFTLRWAATAASALATPQTRTSSMYPLKLSAGPARPSAEPLAPSTTCAGLPVTWENPASDVAALSIAPSTKIFSCCVLEANVTATWCHAASLNVWPVCTEVLPEAPADSRTKVRPLNSFQPRKKDPAWVTRAMSSWMAADVLK